MQKLLLFYTFLSFWLGKIHKITKKALDLVQRTLIIYYLLKNLLFLCFIFASEGLETSFARNSFNLRLSSRSLLFKKLSICTFKSNRDSSYLNLNNLQYILCKTRSALFTILSIST